MRLSKDLAIGIKQEILNIRPSAEVRLFGSRVDDNKKGGDIDILILDTKSLNLQEKMNLKITFQKRFGERKIDIASFSQDDQDPFKNFILPTSISL